MLRELKVFLAGALVVMASARTASAFALYGPGSGGGVTGQGGTAAAEAWQTAQIGFALSPADFGSYEGSDIGTPRNIGEEYRWNTPVLYYAADSTFLVEAFGISNGLAAVDAAFAVLNGALTNGVSSYSSSLSEVPLNTTRVNPRAAALGLADLKSQLVSIMLEELGLGSAERWCWCLHDRWEDSDTVPCPGSVYYEVVRRNFDPVTGLQTNYVNGTLYTYRIVEICTATTGTELADAFEIPNDSNPQNINPAVASRGLWSSYSGAYYTGLSRDDVGGLRYLFRPGNINTEVLPTGVVQISGGSGGLTDTPTNAILVTSNLAELVSASYTNSDTALVALFPELVIAGSSSFPTLEVSSNTFAYYTNYPQAPYGTPATLVTGVTYTTNVAIRYTRAFANVVTNSYYTNGLVTVITTNVAISPQAPYGSPAQTNVTSTTTLQSFINGDYYFIPTNICGFAVLSNLLTQVIPITTTIVATNTSATNLDGQSFAQTTVTYLTNQTLWVQITPCLTNSTGTGTNATAALRQGMDRMRFIRADYDGLIGQTWESRTNTFSMVSIVNNTTVTQVYRRTITQPDILIRATDQNGDPGDEQLGGNSYYRTIPGYAAGPGVTLPVQLGSGSLAGPGTISGQVVITLNKGTPVWINISPYFLSQADVYYVNYIWGSFDGRTNAPVIYPESTDLQNLENNVLIQITPSTLPVGQVGIFYSQQLTGVGGTGGFTFSLSDAGLPPGLSLSSSGLISGTPTTANTYDFTIHMVDAGLRAVNVSYTITINP